MERIEAMRAAGADALASELARIRAELEDLESFFSPQELQGDNR